MARPPKLLRGPIAGWSKIQVWRQENTTSMHVCIVLTKTEPCLDRDLVPHQSVRQLSDEAFVLRVLVGDPA